MALFRFAWRAASFTGKQEHAAGGKGVKQESASCQPRVRAMGAMVKHSEGNRYL